MEVCPACGDVFENDGDSELCPACESDDLDVTYDGSWMAEEMDGDHESALLSVFGPDDDGDRDGGDW